MSKRSWNALWPLIPGIIFSGLWAFVLLSEWYSVGVEADPETIKNYYFGSETMVGHGGWGYKSAELYARSALIQGLVAVAITTIFVVAAIRRHAVLIWSGYSLLILAIVVELILSSGT